MNVVQVSFGESGISAGPIGYGCWRLCEGDVAHAETLIHTAIDHDMTLIDTADIYGYGSPAGFGGAESILGEVLGRNPGLRGRIVLVTKGGVDLPTPYNSDPAYLSGALDASLARLGVDDVDIYLIHRPDLLAHPADVAGVLDAAVQAGKAKSIGVSNYSTGQVRALSAHLKAPLIALQPEYSAIEQSPIIDGSLDWCAETGAVCLAWSPLAGGALATGTPREGIDRARFDAVMAVIDKLAAREGASWTQVALAFTRRHPVSVIPLVGTQTPERLIDAAGAIEVSISARDFYDIVEASRGTAMP